MKLVPLEQEYDTLENNPKSIKLVPFQQDNRITATDFQQHPFKTAARAVLQPAMESSTGKSMEQMASESTQTPQFDKTAATKPFDANVPDVKDRAMQRVLTGQGADIMSTPANYLAEPLLKGALKIGKGVTQGIGKLTGYEAGRMINSLIKPAQKAFNFGKNPGVQVVREKITANNMEDLGTKVKTALEDASNKLKQRIGLAKSLGGTADYSDMLKPIDEAIARAKRLPKTYEELITRLENAKSDLLQNRDLSKLRPEEAVQLKRDIGDVAKWTKEGTDDETANKALKQAYHSVKTKLETTIPGIKAENERLANLITADVAISKRSNMLQKSDLASGLFEKGSLLTALYGALTGNMHEAVGGLGVYGIKKLMDSPAAKTRSAQWLMNLSESDLKKAIQEMPWIKQIAQGPNNYNLAKRIQFSERGSAGVGGKKRFGYE